MKLRIEDLRLDPCVQSRMGTDDTVVREYAEAIAEKASFPPVIVFHDGENYWLADGFHRVFAAREAEKRLVAAEVRQGTRRDAILYAAGANATHGLRRTNADKRKAVETLLTDEEWGVWSDHEIARKCSVSQPFVTKIRAELTNNGYQWDSKRKGADGRTIDTSNIGKDGVSEPQEKQPGESRKEERSGEIGESMPPDGAPEPGPDNASDQLSAREPRGDVTFVVAEFRAKPGQDGNGVAFPSEIYNAFSMTLEETVEYLQNGTIPDRPGVVMNDSEFLELLSGFANMEMPQKEMKVVFTDEKSAAVA